MFTSSSSRRQQKPTGKYEVSEPVRSAVEKGEAGRRNGETRGAAL